MSDDEESLELIGIPWARYSWSFMSVATWVVVLLGWKYYPIPGYIPELWFLLGMGIQGAILWIYAGPFTWIMGTRKIMLGNAALMTVNEDVWHQGHIPPVREGTAVFTVDDEMVLLKKGRVGGIPVLGIKGKDFCVFPDVPGAEVDNAVLKRLMVDLQPYALEALPDFVKEDFVKDGRVVQRGFNPKRSRIFFGWRLLTDETSKVEARLDLLLRSTSRQADLLESEIRRGHHLQRPEGEPVRIIREEPEPRRSRDLVE